ncbi:TonB-dependent receptor plug domain-containing protein [Flavobacterium rakeshii]|uniref:TonB-dependent receptor plug domain-containing protein n=1 Tax=Flavobacterium rakeshii TaxID=1038845 RepID=A0A6N8HD85_9FLAO|nr:TonB-dependent receptor plug domain-containing protein [Flavobacterium rakeshii]
MNHLSTKTGYYLLKKLFGGYSLLLLLLPVFALAQNSITGKVVSDKGDAIPYVDIFNKTANSSLSTNGKGVFKINASTPQTLVFYTDGYMLIEQTLSPSSTETVITLQKVIDLDELVIQQEKFYSLNKMKDIDGTAIYAGRKTEVISVDKITANKATNNTRQIYAQIAGLTINENSDGGLQLSIGGRGLNPNRTSNFNTRQNGYDISADVLGYPESYYTPPTEALAEIQVIRGAAALQYGTQFGGLVNFKFKAPSGQPIEVVTRNTVGSYNLLTNFTSLSGTTGKFSYYTFFNYKQGDGFRPNSEFNSRNFFANLNYQFTEKTSIHFDYTMFDYLAKQPGGLSDYMFYQDMFQSNRNRNWFDVNWNLLALRLNHHFTDKSQFSLQLFGLDASRNALGFRSNRVANPDIEGTERDLLKGDFVNWGAEARFLQQYDINGNSSALLIGAKYYQARNTGSQGPGSSGSDPNFDYAFDEFPNYANQNDYVYPNLNVAFFAENMFRLSPKFTLTPGIRVENIRTKADGYYRRINTDLAGNVILDETEYENVTKNRSFVLLGLAASYKPNNRIEFYGNLAQNYRSVTFNDIRNTTPSQTIDPNITDEKGYTSDIGVRGKLDDQLSYDASIFGLYYNDKIGEYPTFINRKYTRYRSNVGTAITYGFETLLDWNITNTFFKGSKFKWSLFTNTSITGSEYLKSEVPNIEGNSVEFVPLVNLKAGSGLRYKNFTCNIQLTYLSSQFTDAINSTSGKDDNTYGIFGEIPSYYVADISASYQWKMLKLEAGINNFTNNYYFTRRATGYPGPGIIPSDPRVFYTTLEIKF